MTRARTLLRRPARCIANAVTSPVGRLSIVAIATAALAKYLLRLPASLALTVGVLVGAAGLLIVAICAVRREVDAEGGLAGRTYDAMHSGVQIVDAREAGFATWIVELSYRSRQIVYLDDLGAPASARTCGAGRMTVIASAAGNARLRRRYRRLLAYRSPLAVIERGMQTAEGRVVRECLIAADDAPTVGAELASSSAFPPT